MGSSQAKLDIRIKTINVTLKSAHGFTKSSANLRNLVIQRRKQGFTYSVNSIRRLYRHRKSQGWRVARDADEWIDCYMKRHCLIRIPELEVKSSSRRKNSNGDSSSGYASCCSRNRSQRSSLNTKRLKKNSSQDETTASDSDKQRIAAAPPPTPAAPKEPRRTEEKAPVRPAPVRSLQKGGLSPRHLKPAAAPQSEVKPVAKPPPVRIRELKRTESVSSSYTSSQSNNQLPSVDEQLRIVNSASRGGLLREGFDPNREHKVNFARELELVRKLKRGEFFVDNSIELFDSNPNPNLVETDEEKLIPIEWLVPEKIAPNPVLLPDCQHSSEDIIEGELGDGQFCAALNVIMRYPNLLREILPDEAELLGPGGSDYRGWLKFRFWSFGSFVDVLVDDRLPTKKGWLLTCRVSSRLNVFWPALLEKAFAKFVGSYKNLFNLTCGQILTSLTGGLFLTFKTSQLSTLPRQFAFEDANRHLIGITSKKPTEETFMKENYCSVLALNRIQVNGKTMRIYTLRNVCQRTKYNKYPYYNSNLKLADEETKRRIMYPNSDDSISWFASFELRKMFDTISWLYVLPYEAEEPGSVFNFVGRWSKANLAEDKTKNKHYLLKVAATSSPDAPKTEVIVNVHLHPSDLARQPDTAAKNQIDLWCFNVNRLDASEDELLGRIGYVYYSFTDCDIQPLDLTATQGSVTLSLFPGSYVLTPAVSASLVSESSSHCRYMFRVGCRTPGRRVDVEELDFGLDEFGLAKFRTEDRTGFVNVISRKCMVCDRCIAPGEAVKSAERTVYHAACHASLLVCDWCGSVASKPFKAEYNFVKCERCVKKHNQEIEALNRY